MSEPRTRVDLGLAWRDPIVAFAPLEGADYALLLHSGPPGRWSLIAANPRATFEGMGRGPLLAAERAAADWARRRTGDLTPSVGPFGGGVAGLLTYELGGALGPGLALPGGAWPDAALGLYEAAAVFDHDAQSLRVIGEAAAAQALAGALGDEPLPLPGSAGGRVEARRIRAQVEAAIARAIAYVRAGDVFQVNLSQAFSATLAPSDNPFSVFRRLLALSPAPFAAYFRLDADRVVVSHSPERFLSLSPDGGATSRPIKGTRPRRTDPDADKAERDALLGSEKDRAENLMIVDLMRNDLARVCVAGSVRAPELFKLESYANVHHLVSTVTGQLAEGRGASDLLAASFPAGSVTGAPKIRAMQIIAELEGEPRGPYCGSLGYLGFDGRADFSVLIRTIACVRSGGAWTVEARAGGGIVADSDPGAEYDETLAKAASIVAALGGLTPLDEATGSGGAA